jgi:hypothetical protein
VRSALSGALRRERHPECVAERVLIEHRPTLRVAPSRALHRCAQATLIAPLVSVPLLRAASPLSPWPTDAILASSPLFP